MVTQSAEQIALAAAPLLAVIALGASVAETGSLQTALTLPFLLFAIPAGLPDFHPNMHLRSHPLARRLQLALYDRSC